MITVLDPRTKLPVHFPDAVAICPSACPAEVCSSPREDWLCVLGVQDGEVVCLAGFPPESTYAACNCPGDSCPHLDPSEGLHGAILDELEALHGDPAPRREQARAAARRQVLGLPEEPHHRPDGRARVAALTKHAPHLAAHLTFLKPKENVHAEVHPKATDG